MNKYKFPIDQIVGVMQHVQAYDAVVQSLTADENNFYTMILDRPIIPEELSHLTEGYNLTEVVE